MLRPRFLRLALFALFLMMCTLRAEADTASRRAEQAFVRHAPVPAWVLPSPALPEAIDAPFSVRLNDVQLRLDAQPASYVHRALVARDMGSLQQVANIELSFQPEYEVLQMHQLLVHRDGRTEDRLGSADIRFLQRERGLEQGMYSGSVTVAIVMPDLRVGDTLEIAYTTTGANPVFENRYMDAAQWDAPFPVAYRRVVLDTPEGRPVGHRLIGPAGGTLPVVSEQRRDGRLLRVFEGRKLPATLFDAGAPRDVQAARWLQFSEYASWSDVNAGRCACSRPAHLARPSTPRSRRPAPRPRLTPQPCARSSSCRTTSATCRCRWARTRTARPRPPRCWHAATATARTSRCCW
ncbi:DUF3857 domain-containing protein [Massilia sp. Se16.2.3]|uniref:DUF3857 domain-containing protein n=1 Tax=Massilia sp. Se16.2.3 TaxID=2709303 RepID=UPI001E2E4711|nr:DUF3857 domain-containing protein [Massilia sp. Se16.2.3]